MDRQGRVQRLYEDGTALVICTESCVLDCNQCAGGCREWEGLIARNPEGAQLGELVLVRTHRMRILMASFMLFILPIVSFFVGYWVGAVLYSAGKVTGCLALVLGVGISLVYDRRTASKRGSGYTVIKYPQNINKGDN